MSSRPLLKSDSSDPSANQPKACFDICFFLTQKKRLRMLKNLLKSELSGCSCINLRIDVNTHRALSCNKHPSHRSSFAKKKRSFVSFFGNLDQTTGHCLSTSSTATAGATI